MSRIQSVHRLAVIGALLLSATACSLSVPIWEVSDGENKLYLSSDFGIPVRDDDPLSGALERAYVDSDVLYSVMDYEAMADPTLYTDYVRQRLSYSGERSLQDVLSEEAWTALTDFMAGKGIPLTPQQEGLRDEELYGELSDYMAALEIPLEPIDKALPVRLGAIIAFLHYGGEDPVFNSHVYEDGIFQRMYNRVMRDGKPIDRLETVAKRIDEYASLAEGEESEFVLSLLQDNWGEFNIDQETLEVEIPEGNLLMNTMYDYLMQRRLRLLPQLEAMLGDADTEFVLVDAVDIIPGDGLPRLLRAKGYAITGITRAARMFPPFINPPDHSPPSERTSE